MADRNTRVRKGQINADSVEPTDLDALNSPSAGQVPALGSGGQFEWVDQTGGSTLITINEQTDSYTLVLSDKDKLIDMNKATALTLTIPKNSVVAFDIGTKIAMRQKGAGALSVAPVDGDVTINESNGLTLTAQYSVAWLIKIATNTWTLYGELGTTGVGDMLKSTYDTDDDGIVDKAENVDDGTSGGIHASTAEQVRDAVDKKHTHVNQAQLDLVSDGDHDVRTDNPHSVTKTQVGLGNVTNDAQLKENISSYTEKVTPANDDLLLLEDSEESGTPVKKVKKSNIVPAVDNYTIINDSGVLKIADRIELNILLNFFRDSVNAGSVKYNLIDGFIDEFEDESGIDTSASTNETYDSGNDLYSPDYTPADWDSYTKLMLHGNGTNGSTTITDEMGKTVTNTANYDSYTKLCSHFDGADEAVAYTDPIAGAYTFAGTTDQLDTAQKKFGTASLLLDGNSDWIELADSANWNFSTGDFTIDGWVYFNSLPPVAATIVTQYADGDNHWFVSYSADNKLNIYFITGAAVVGYYSCSWTPVVNTWYHLAFERTTTSAKIFINGVSQVLTENTAFSTNDVGNVAGKLKIGAFGADAGEAYFFNGWIDELRISKGIARWTTDFTAPVAPYGQVTIDTGVKKFGTGSLLFDGGGSYLSLADSADWSFGTGDFTIDFWARFTDLTNNQAFVSQYEDADNGWWIYFGTGKIYVDFEDGGVKKGQYSTTSAAITATNQWYHIAIVRSTTTCKIFVNGVSVTVTETTAFSTNDVGDIAGKLKIGAFGADAGEAYFFNGWIDELRISKGIARWTSSFSVPTSEYTEDPATYHEMTLISEAIVAESVPTQARIVLFEEDVSEITLNTDLKAYASRDNGTTWTQLTLVDEGDYETNKRVLSAVSTSITTQPSGSNMRIKLTTHNNKDLKLHGQALQWA